MERVIGIETCDIQLGKRLGLRTLECRKRDRSGHSVADVMKPPDLAKPGKTERNLAVCVLPTVLLM